MHGSSTGHQGMSSTYPVTESGEFALAQLALRISDHRILSSYSEPKYGRRVRNVTAARLGNVLTDLVAVAENFTVARLLAIRPLVGPEQAYSWTDRQKAWSRYAHV